MTEAEYQDLVTGLCDLLGLLYHHETDSRKSNKGFPDLCIVGTDGMGVVFLELKGDRKGAKASPDQVKWIDRLQKAGIRAYVVYPKDWDKVQDLLFALAGRARK